MSYSTQDGIEAIQKAAKILGHSPSNAEYRSLNLSPSASTIEQRLGGWDKVKEQAGLELCGRGDNTKYDVNSHFFESIDSPEKAYWLGMLYGDGWLTESTGVVGLALQEKAHVERFREAIESDHPIEERNGIYRIRIGRENMVESLSHLGFDGEKTNSSTLPDITESLQCHFIRGLSDADGTFADNTGCVGFTWRITGSSRKRFERIADWLPVKGHIYPQGDECYMIQVSNQANLQTLTSWMYPNGKDTKPAMPRKLALAHY